MDDIDREIQAWREKRAQEEEEKRVRIAEALRERLEKRRADFREERFKPDCTCNSCLRAVLTLTPSLVCKNGRHLEWWK